MHALILSGGLGTRLQSLVPDCPKILAPLRGRPFIDYQLSALREAGVDSVTLCTGHLADQIEEYLADGARFGLTVSYSREDAPLGTGGAVRQAASLVEVDHFLVANGDTYVDCDIERLFARHKAAGAAITVALVPRPTREMGSVDLGDSGHVLRFLEKEEAMGRPASGTFANAGLYVMDRSVVISWPEGPASLERDYLPRLAQERRVFGEIVAARFYDIGTPAGFQRFEDAVITGQISLPPFVSSPTTGPVSGR